MSSVYKTMDVRLHDGVFIWQNLLSEVVHRVNMMEWKGIQESFFVSLKSVVTRNHSFSSGKLEYLVIQKTDAKVLALDLEILCVHTEHYFHVISAEFCTKRDIKCNTLQAISYICKFCLYSCFFWVFFFLNNEMSIFS